MKKSVFLLPLVTAFFFSANAQESIGLFYDNYLPSNSMLKNPAAPVFSPFKWQVNIISAGAFAENNLIYLQNESNLRLLSNRQNDNTLTPSFANVTNAHAHIYTFIEGPSGFVQLKHFTIGIITDEKYAGSLVSLNSPQSLSGFQQIIPGRDYTVPSFGAGYLHWTEIGINLGTLLYQTDEANLAVGINVKYLGGQDALYLNNNQSFTVNRDSFFTQQSLINANFGYTSTAGTNQPGSPFNFNFNGRGIGGDVGMLYTVNSRNDKELYDWKIGLSVNDIGAISFNRQSSTYAFNRNTIFQEETTLLQQTGDLNTLAGNGSGIVYDAAAQAKTGSAYKMVLPTAISVTAEKSLTHNFYISALAVRRMVLGKNTVEHPNTFALTPSFEKKWIAFAVPVVMYDDRKMYFGSSLRIGPFTIGSDNIMSWFVPKNYFGSDIYVGLHINPFSFHSGKGGTGDFRNHYNNKLQCPDFKSKKG